MIARCRFWRGVLTILSVCFALIILSDLARAGEVWAHASVTSVHISHKDFNRNNRGLGVEYVTGDYLGSVGQYRNSEGTKSRYASVGWTPLHWPGVDVGLVAGVVDGYAMARGGGVVPMAAVLIRISGESVGLNLMLIPPARGAPAAVGFQIRMRAW